MFHYFIKIHTPTQTPFKTSDAPLLKTKGYKTELIFDPREKTFDVELVIYKDMTIVLRRPLPSEVVMLSWGFGLGIILVPLCPASVRHMCDMVSGQ